MSVSSSCLYYLLFKLSHNTLLSFHNSSDIPPFRTMTITARTGEPLPLLQLWRAAEGNRNRLVELWKKTKAIEFRMMITSTYVVATLFHSSSRYELISTLSSRTHSKLVLKSAEEGLQLSIRPSMSKLGILLQSKDFPLVISTKNHWAKYRYNQCVFHWMHLKH